MQIFGVRYSLRTLGGVKMKIKSEIKNRKTNMNSTDRLDEKKEEN